jgi:hypothetical protein
MKTIKIKTIKRKLKSLDQLNKEFGIHKYLLNSIRVTNSNDYAIIPSMISMFGDDNLYEFIRKDSTYYTLFDIHSAANGCLFHKDWLLSEEDTYFHEFIDEVEKLFREVI